MEHWPAEGSGKAHMHFSGAKESAPASGISPQMVIPVQQWKWPYARLFPAVHWENGSVSIAALGQISYRNLEATTPCATSPAPEELQMLPKIQLCRTQQIIQTCVS